MAPLTIELEGIVAALLQEHSRDITLSELAIAIGDLPVTPPQIETIFSRLEAGGLSVESPSPVDVQANLRRVLGCARELKALGQPAAPRLLAERLGMPEAEVRATLLYGRTLGV